MTDQKPESLNPLDVEQERKVARRLLKTPEGRAALRDVTGHNFVLATEVEKKPIVAVLTPSYSGLKQKTREAFERMVMYSQPHCVVVPDPGVSSSVVHWVRNELLVRRFKTGTPFDYVLFMDDDMVPAEDTLVRLLSHGVDIVAGACTVRYDPPMPNFRAYDPATYTYTVASEWHKEGLIQVGAVGTGFMLIRRHTLGLIADYYLNCEHEKRFFGMSEEVAKRISEQRWATLEKTHNAWWFEFLKHPLGEGEFGEDVSFCFKAMQQGVQIYVDTTVQPGHVGEYIYGIPDFLHYRTFERARVKFARMFNAATGKPVHVDPVKQPAEPTKKVSVMIPSRGRPDLLAKSIASLLDTAEGDVEVLVRFDDDDKETAGAVPHKGSEVVSEWAGKIKVKFGQRHGYRNLHLYYNELAEIASGDWLLLWNDDAVMNTEGWDAKIHAAGGGLKVLNATGRLNLFPIFTKKLRDVLGHVSLQAHSDSWLQVVSRVNGIEYPVELEIKHLREEIEDKTKAETQPVYAESSPEFFSTEFQELLAADCDKVAGVLAAKPREVLA